MKSHLNEIRSQATPFSARQPGVHSAAEYAYFDHYGLNFKHASHTFGMVTVGQSQIATHRYEPKNIRGAVLIVHGYYDHAATWRHIIQHLLQNGYAVTLYDQPGHGLSSGAPAAIDSFSTYTNVLGHFDKRIDEHYSVPVHLLAHSMGAGITLDYLQSSTTQARTGNVILLAPLIRSSAWTLSGSAFSSIGKRFDSIPRTFRKNCGNRPYLAFVKAQDPLQARTVPSSWVKAHRAWEQKTQSWGTREQRLTILQGSKDTTVDFKHNLPFIQEHFTNSRQYMIPKAGHQLMNELTPLRTTIQDAILAALNAPVS